MPKSLEKLIYFLNISVGLLLLLLSHFSRVRLCATPYTAAHQAPPSLGFSRQEHWSELPFPSPMQESEKWKWSPSVMFDSSWTAAYQAPPSMGFSRQEYWSGVPSPSPLNGASHLKCKRIRNHSKRWTNLLKENPNFITSGHTIN